MTTTDDPRRPGLSPEDEELRLTFLEHLEELRTRLIRGLSAIGICALAAYGLSDKILKVILPPEGEVIALAPAEHFFPYIEIALVVGLLVSFPYLVAQVWGFVSPGLYKTERRSVFPLVIASSACFYGGVLFAHFLMLPVLLDFLPKFSAGQIRTSYAAGAYLHFYLKMILVFGVCFNAPVVVSMLTMLGIVDTKTISKSRPYVVVGIFVAAAFLTPPEAVTQVMLGGPLWLLFEIGLIVSRILEYRRARRERVETDETQRPDSTPSA